MLTGTDAQALRTQLWTFAAFAAGVARLRLPSAVAGKATLACSKERRVSGAGAFW